MYETRITSTSTRISIISQSDHGLNTTLPLNQNFYNEAFYLGKKKGEKSCVHIVACHPFSALWHKAADTRHTFINHPGTLLYAPHSAVTAREGFFKSPTFFTKTFFIQNVVSVNLCWKRGWALRYFCIIMLVIFCFKFVAFPLVFYILWGSLFL